MKITTSNWYSTLKKKLNLCSVKHINMKMYRGVETQLHTFSALDRGDTIHIKNYIQINSLEKLSSVGGKKGSL